MYSLSCLWSAWCYFCCFKDRGYNLLGWRLEEAYKGDQTNPGSWLNSEKCLLWPRCTIMCHLFPNFFSVIWTWNVTRYSPPVVNFMILLPQVKTASHIPYSGGKSNIKRFSLFLLFSYSWWTTFSRKAIWWHHWWGQVTWQSMFNQQFTSLYYTIWIANKPRCGYKVQSTSVSWVCTREHKALWTRASKPAAPWRAENDWQET